MATPGDERVAVFRIKADCPAVGGHGILVPAQCGEGVSQVVVGEDVPRVEFDCLGQIGKAFLHLAQLPEDRRPIAVCRYVLRIKIDAG